MPQNTRLKPYTTRMTKIQGPNEGKTYSNIYKDKRTQSDIRVKSYFHLNLLGSFVFNFEALDILWDSIRHLTKKLLPFEFARIFHF